MSCVRLMALCLIVNMTIHGPALFAAREDIERPNIIFIVADDLGYADLSVQRAQDLTTPHIDSIARNGVRCTSGYVSAPVCSPARAGFITGRYQQRFGHEFNTGPFPPAHVGLPVEEKTLGDVLQPAGYVTGVVGKWHLGIADDYHPLQRGFDEFYGILVGARAYFDITAEDETRPVFRQWEPQTEQEAYLTDVLNREAVSFIERHHDRPFFLFLSYTAPHLPMHATEAYLARFPDVEPQRRRTLAAMVAAMDDGVGMVLDTLRERGIEQNTIIIFISDNGGYPRNATRNDPLRGQKGQLFEGGIRVPFLIQWKGQLPAGKVYDHPVIALDVFATAAAAARAEMPHDRTIDGVNLLPHLGPEDARPPHEHLFWRYGPNWAVRKGNFKLVKQDDMPPPHQAPGTGGRAQLFDLSNDIAEEHDLSSEKPEVVRELQEAYNEWDRQMIEPRWTPEQGQPRGQRDEG